MLDTKVTGIGNNLKQQAKFIPERGKWFDVLVMCIPVVFSDFSCEPVNKKELILHNSVHMTVAIAAIKHHDQNQVEEEKICYGIRFKVLCLPYKFYEFLQQLELQVQY
ncbi:hypothetical protein H671_5g14891 [Cricetulus griseus]|uniref:Uncharacterized protein n=1 Tax=Cricetulus griseus TaxID=10029 RepID=A0A061I3E1_CRIGR|nr:hypothetical protein H671_5g14891 [Cricetulus griseus]